MTRIVFDIFFGGFTKRIFLIIVLISLICTIPFIFSDRKLEAKEVVHAHYDGDLKIFSSVESCVEDLIGAKVFEKKTKK